ncbi:TPA: hypothetical protein TUF52_001243 [Streptococcus equi subsp. zooepidemicus]|nr:hypothetical protein [Streptococcus equi subsp. zooepidemicus]
MIYKKYHTALVFTLVLQHLLKDTELEEKAFNLYADIVEQERVPMHQIKSANLYSKRIIRAFEKGKISQPSPFTRWQKVREIISRSISKMIKFFTR